MTVARIRIRSVKMKNGGASVRVLHNDKCAHAAADFASTCRTISERRGEDIAGYAVVAWGRDGSTSTSVHVVDGSVVPRMLVSEYVKAAILDYLISSES